MAHSPSNPLQPVAVSRLGQGEASPEGMGDQSEPFRRLKELREELATLNRRSVTTLTEIAKIQVRIQELADRLRALSSHHQPNGE